MIIREETIKDYAAVFSLVKKAFASGEHSDGNEQDLVDALRKSTAYIPQLSLVAESEGKIIGYIMFTRASVADHVVLALAPLAVLPGFQSHGVGSALVRAGHKAAKKLGYGYSVVLGSETYYPRFGYVPAEMFGIRAPFHVYSQNFMAVKLDERAPDVRGVMVYAKEFGLN